MRTCAFHARSMSDSVLSATSMRDPALLDVFGCPALSKSCFVRFRSAPRRGRARSSVQFERRSEAERARVRAAISKAHAAPKRAREATSRAPARPRRLERLVQASRWRRTSSSGQFDRRREAERSQVDSSSQSRAFQRGRGGPNDQFERPSEARRARSRKHWQVRCFRAPWRRWRTPEQ